MADLQLEAMRLGNALGDMKAEAKAVRMTAARFVGPERPLDKLRQGLIRDPGAVIDDPKREKAVFASHVEKQGNVALGLAI